MPRRDELPPHSEIGYIYDWTRQRQKQNIVAKDNYKKLKKKVNTLSKKNKVIRRK